MKRKRIFNKILGLLTVMLLGIASTRAQMAQIIYGNAQPTSRLPSNSAEDSTNPAVSAKTADGQAGSPPYKSIGSEPLGIRDSDFFAELCEFNDDAYEPNGFKNLPTGWKVKSLRNDPNINATLLYNSGRDLAVVVFRGTEMKDLFQRDGKTDIAAFVIGMPTKNFPEAVQAVKQAQSYFPKSKFIVTGHSLGGLEAAYAAAMVEPRVKAMVFSSPGLPSALYENSLDQSKEWIYTNVLNVYLIGDKFSEIGMNPDRYTKNRLVSRAHGHDDWLSDDKMQPEGTCPAYYFPLSIPVQNNIPNGLGPLGFLNKHVKSPDTIIKLIPLAQRQQIDAFLDSSVISTQSEDLSSHTNEPFN